MRRLTLCLLLDAFRPDYLRHAPYLRGLGGGRAELREPFGFLPRAAYFGGLTPAEAGFTNMYAYDPSRSPFGLARAFSASTAGAPALERLGVRDVIDQSARNRVAPFARTYASSASIPLQLLPSFDIVEQHAPWDRNVGYRSIFHELDERGLSWFECSWPGTNALADRSDRGIVRAAIERATPGMRFGFVHLQELDACGHAYGPEAPETRDCIRQTDRLVETLVETLRARTDRLDLVIFGDHGMVSVTRSIDIGAALAKMPLALGSDFTCFLDSTMARFWPHSAEARTRLPEALGTIDGARLLSPDDLRRFRIDGCDPRNGELIVLAEPGVVFQPNFFQGSGEPPRGMHGYDPDCPDNRGVFLCQSDRLAAPEGVVDATGIHGLLMTLLDDGPPARMRAAGKRQSSRFTRQPDPGASAAVDRDLRTITDAIIAESGAPRAIVLTGSFGRGEGGVVREGERFRAINDYDVLVIDERDRTSELKRLTSRLQLELGIDFVDLAWADGRWLGSRPTIHTFDMKYGSTVIYGDPSAMDPLPAFAASEIPAIEGLQLLLNRTAGLLSGMTNWSSAAPLDWRQHCYLVNQYVKAAVALGDTYLLAWRGYDSSYLARARRFRSLAPGAGLPPALVEMVAQAYVLKVAPDYRAVTDARALVRQLIPELTQRIPVVVASCGGKGGSLVEAMTSYLDLVAGGDAAADNAHLLGHPAVASIAGGAAHGSLRAAIYSALPFVLSAADRSMPACATSSWPSAPFVQLPEAVDWHGWEQLRERTIAAWFAAIH